MGPVEYTPSESNEYTGANAGGDGWQPGRCGWCGGQNFEEGFLEDSGGGSNGRARWVEGPLQFGILGGPRLLGRPRRDVLSHRCTDCGHLEFFTTDYS